MIAIQRLISTYINDYLTVTTYNQTGVIAYFSRVALSDWKFTNKLKPGMSSANPQESVKLYYLVDERVDALG